MQNTFKLSSYSPFSDIDVYQTQYIFHYNLLTADKIVVDKYTKRWIGKDSVLQAIEMYLINGNDDWQDHIIESKIDLGDTTIPMGWNPFRLEGEGMKYKYARDLRGIKMANAIIKYPFHAIHYCKMDYSLFEKCSFIGNPLNILQGFSGFWANSLNHTRFINCSFENCWFNSGEYNHIVFYDCKFNKVAFNRHWDGVYSHIFFQNCKFNDVDFTRVDIKTFCFLGNCEFDDIKINTNDNYDKIIGADIINFSKSNDIQTYNFRKGVKATQYNNGNTKFIYYEKGEKRRSIPKIFFTIYVYEGLTTFYHNLFHYYETKGEYTLASNLQYCFSYCKDEAYQNKSTFSNKIKILINRTLLGYGWRYERTLYALLIMTIATSFIYLFSGITYNKVIIQRSLSLNLSEIEPTFIDWLRCLYFSLKTTTTIGYGSFLPTSAFSLATSFVQGFIGFIMFTIFIVIFSRRFFK